MALRNNLGGMGKISFDYVNGDGEWVSKVLEITALYRYS